MSDKCIIVRGGGDLASGVIHRLHRCGYRVLILECEKPSAIRRKVAFCEAVYDGTAAVEGILCRRIFQKARNIIPNYQAVTENNVKYKSL